MVFSEEIQIASGVHFTLLGKHRVLVSEPAGYQILTGPLPSIMAQLILQKYGVEHIIGVLADAFPATYIHYVLQRWRNEGWLVDTHVNDEVASKKNFVDESQHIELNGCSTLFVPISELADKHCLFKHQAIQAVVAVMDNPLNPALSHIEKFADQQMIPVLWVWPQGSTTLLGPLKKPGRDWCHTCVQRLIRRNRPDLAYRTNLQEMTEASCWQWIQRSVYQIIGEALSNDRMGKESRLTNALLTINHDRNDESWHSLAHMARCPKCAQNQEYPKKGNKHRDNDIVHLGQGYRTQKPEALVEELRSIEDPLTGIVRSCKRSDHFGSKGPVITSTYQGLHHESIDTGLLIRNLYPVSGGKGRSLVEARISGLCEGIERYAMGYQGTEKVLIEVPANVPGPSVYPDVLMGMSSLQYETRETWNEAHPSRMHYIPEPYSTTSSIGWSPVIKTGSKEIYYAPTAFCYGGYKGPGSTFAFCDSNGHAVGSTLEEAMLQGVLELIERDAVAIWWYNQIPRPEINLSSILDPQLKNLISNHLDAEREVKVIDVTSDIGIPVFASISLPIEDKDGYLLLGFGCHPDPTIAISRALLELGQVGQSLNDAKRTPYVAETPGAHTFKQWEREATRMNLPFLSGQVGVEHLGNYEKPAFKSIHTCLCSILDRIHDQGLEVFMLDQTRSETPLYAVKMIAPGMRHFWRRLGPGRLYNVPVKMGWLKEPHTEVTLNNLPLSC